MQQPTIGRIVHYVSYGTPGGEYTSQCRAATIAEVGAWVTMAEQYVAAHDATEQHRARDIRQWWVDDALGLMVSNPTGLFFDTCRHDEGAVSATPGAPGVKSYAGGTWHWPERVS